MGKSASRPFWSVHWERGSHSTMSWSLLPISMGSLSCFLCRSCSLSSQFFRGIPLPGQALLRPPASSHGLSPCSDRESAPGWETGSPSRTRFLDFSRISSNLALGAGTECLHSLWVKATVTLSKGVDPCGPAVKRPAPIPSTAVLSSWERVGSGGGGSSSSIWVSSRDTASQQLSGRQRRFTAARAPL